MSFFHLEIARMIWSDQIVFHLFFTLLTHEGSHSKAYRDFQPSLTSSTGPVPAVVSTTGSVQPQPALPNCQLCVNSEPTINGGQLI